MESLLGNIHKLWENLGANHPKGNTPVKNFEADTFENNSLINGTFYGKGSLRFFYFSTCSVLVSVAIY